MGHTTSPGKPNQNVQTTNPEEARHNTDKGDACFEYNTCISNGKL